MLKHFYRARSGVAALEFALILPLVLLGFVGANEISSAVQVSQKVSQTASTVADLAAQATTISNADETNIFSAANAILFPYSGSGEIIVISSVVDNGGGMGRVVWSDANSGPARTVGSTLPLPSGVITTGGSVILAEVHYSYTPAPAYVTNGAIHMSSQFFSRPRRVASIPRV